MLSLENFLQIYFPSSQSSGSSDKFFAQWDAKASGAGWGTASLVDGSNATVQVSDFLRLFSLSFIDSTRFCDPVELDVLDVDSLEHLFYEGIAAIFGQIFVRYQVLVFQYNVRQH